MSKNLDSPVNDRSSQDISSLLAPYMQAQPLKTIVIVTP